MKNISLIKVTVMVISVGFASNFVNAEDKINKTVDKAQVDIAKTVEEAEQIKFSDLLEELDSDKNGMLSQAEASADQNKILQDEFKRMDVNKDKQIDELEFNNYIAEVQNKVADLARSIK